MGHPVEIFLTSPPDSSICAICHDVFKDAVSMKECGHTFCSDCAKDCMRSNSNSCPNCRVRVTGTNPNFFARDSVHSMEVKCLNGHNTGDDQPSTRRRGNDGEALPPESCTWTGKCEDAMAHQNVCSFKVITCDWDGCSHQCMRKYMNDHLSGDGSLRHMNLLKQSVENEMHDIKQTIYNHFYIKVEREIQSIKAACEREIAEMKEQIKEMKERNMASSGAPPPQGNDISHSNGGGGNSVCDAVITFLRDEGSNNDTGIHISHIQEALSGIGFSAADVNRAILDLSNEGHIYSTIDEEHFQYAP